MPYAVQSSDYRSFGSHERVAHPYGKDRVLLAESLAGSDCTHRLASRHKRLIISFYRRGCPWHIAASDKPSHRKLEYTAEQGNHRHPQQQFHTQCTVDYGLCSHGNGQSERYRPQVEGQIRISEEFLVKTRCKVSHHPGGKAREDEQRKDPGDYDSEGHPEIHSLYRLYQRDYQRHQHSRQNIYQYGIGRDACHIPSQLARHYGRRGRSRAYKAEHGAFDQHDTAMMVIWEKAYDPYSKQPEGGEQATLDQKQPPMPAMWLEVLGLYAAEGKEKHGEYQQRLRYSHDIRQHRACLVNSRRQSMIEEIQRSSRHHGDGEHPIL